MLRKRHVYLIEVSRAGRVVWRHCSIRRSQVAAQKLGENQLRTLGSGHTCVVFRCSVDAEVWSAS